MEFTVTRLGECEASRLWQEYADAVGLETLHAAYGDHWPRPVLHDETVFEFRIPTCGGNSVTVGWASALYDQAERVVWQSHGIWPAFQKQNVTPYVTRWLRAWAFNHTTCVAVCCKILDTNAFYQKWMREKNPNKGWVYSGHIFLPEPGFDQYTYSREYWQEHDAEQS